MSKNDKSYKYYEGSGILEQHVNDMLYHYDRPEHPESIPSVGWFTPSHKPPRNNSTIINKSLLKEEDWW